MEEQLITEILLGMQGKINQSQSQQLKTVVYVVLQHYCVSEKSTELICPDNTYEYYLNMFLVRKHTEGKPESTIKQYQFHLSRMLQLLEKPVPKITEQDLFCYLTKYKHDRQVSNTYLDNIRLVFSTFFGWLNNKGFITRNPAAGLEPIKSAKRIKKALTEEELERLRRVCERQRDMALIEFLYSTGVRVSELIALNREDINFNGKDVIVYGKGSKERETYLTATSCLYLREYLNSRTDCNKALFVSTRLPHQRLTVSGVEAILKKIGLMAGVEKVHPHKFRRTMATNALKKGMPLEEVKELLGHTKLDTTMIYCVVNKDNVRYHHQKYMSV